MWALWGGRERDRDRPFTICGSVSCTHSKAFCRAICSSLGRQQAKLLEKKKDEEEGLAQEDIMSFREDKCCQDARPNLE